MEGRYCSSDPSPNHHPPNSFLKLFSLRLTEINQAGRLDGGAGGGGSHSVSQLTILSPGRISDLLKVIHRQMGPSGLQRRIGYLARFCPCSSQGPWDLKIGKSVSTVTAACEILQSQNRHRDQGLKLKPILATDVHPRETMENEFFV